jgi:hypothetical protein
MARFPEPLGRVAHALCWQEERLRAPRGFDRPIVVSACPPRVPQHDSGTLPLTLPAAVSPGAAAAPFEVVALADDGGVRQLLVLFTPLANSLPTRQHLLAHAIDTAPPLDQLCETARAIAGAGEHALVCDASVFHLVDLDREEVLLSGDRASAWEEYLLPVLSGSPASLRRRLAALPRRSDLQLGIELRRFLESAGERLARAAGRAPADGARLALALLASAHRWRFDPHPSPTSPRRLWDAAAWVDVGRPARPAGAAASGAAAAGTGTTSVSWFDLNLLASTFEADYRLAPLSFWRIDDRARWILDWCGLATADHRAVAAEVILDFLRLAPMRLRQGPYEVALLDEAQLHLATRLRVQSSGVTLASCGLAHEGAIIYRPAAIDYATEGVGRALDTLRFLLDYWEREEGRQREEARSGRQAAVVLDLFQTGSPGAGGEGRIEDPVMTTLHDSLRIHGAPPGEWGVLEFLVATTVWDWAWRGRPGEQPMRGGGERRLSLASLGRLLGAP